MGSVLLSNCVSNNHSIQPESETISSRSSIDANKLRKRSKNNPSFWGKNPKDTDLLSQYASDYDTSTNPSSSIKIRERTVNLLKRRSPNNAKELLSELQSLAILYYENKNYSKALNTNNEVIKLRSAQSDRDLSKNIFNIILNGHIYNKLGVFSKAKKYYLQALKIAYSSNKPSHISTAFNNLGVLNANMGRNNVALSYFIRAEQNNPSSGLFGTEINLGSAYRKANKKQKALKILKQFYNDGKTLMGSDIRSGIDSDYYEQSLVAFAARELARTYQDMHQYNNADKFYLVSLLMTQDVLGKKDLYLSHLLSHYSSFLRETNHNSSSIFFAKLSINNIQTYRSKNNKLTDKLKFNQFEGLSYYYRQLISFLIKDGRLNEANDVFNLFKTKELLNSKPNDHRAIPYTQEESKWKTKYDRLSQRLEALRNKRQRLKAHALSSSGSRKEVSQTMTEYKKVEEKVIQLKIAFKNFYNQSKLIKPYEGTKSSSTNTYTKLKNATKKSMLVRYLLFKDNIYILTATKLSYQYKIVSVNRKNLSNTISSFRKAIEGKNKYKIYSTALYQILIKPIENSIKDNNIETLLFSLDSDLNYIPMAALYDGEKHLLEKYTLKRFVPLKNQNISRKKAPQRAIAFGTSGNRGEKSIVQSDLDTDKVLTFSSLVGTLKTANAIIDQGKSDADGGVFSGKIYFDDSFTLGNFQKELNSGYKVLHLATHFYLSPYHESFSFLLMGNNQKLSLEKIRKNRINFNHYSLVTLSACQTAINTDFIENRRSEIEGLGLLIRRAGADSVIASLWNVNDESTGRIMRAMYKNWTEEGMQLEQALRIAQLSLFKRTETISKDQTNRAPTVTKRISPSSYKHPYYWSSFILMSGVI